MSPTNLLALFGATWLLIQLCRIIFSKTQSGSHKAPPGPPGLPLIGHLPMLGNQPHRSLHKLSQKYGPIMSLRLGSQPTIVVSSPASAELFLKTHDTVFASRPRSQAAEYMWYGTKGMIFSEYGPYWRSIRKFCTLELLSASKIESMAGLRRDELGLLVESLRRAAGAREVVDVSEKVTRLIEDMTCRMLFGKCRDERFDLRETIHDMGKLVGAFNIADYYPFLGALDLQGLTRQLKQTHRAIDKILEIIIDDHEKEADNGIKKLDRDFLDVILSLKTNPKTTHEQLAQNIDRSSIKAIVLDMIFGAIDTSHIAIEWIMSELLRHPRVMKLVQEEIRNVVGDCEVVEESCLSELPYLDMVVKESLRLHPVGPLLVPHASMEDIVIEGYGIQKKSRVIINNWGMGHDPRIWSENCEKFLPERFIDGKVDIRGNNFQLIPFGSGRRGCPGMHLGLVTTKLVVSQLVHSFDWELPFGMSADELDMNEIFGATMPRAKHLLAVPSARFG
ncbi:hypothetical protein DCAR_0313053 [Daucus carota subsp. sativus]|uniref:Cytochrome P450 CYP736A12-like n=1 Tax=Daucus carota subsp. sativus TaxID=79200 RepID=A0AAF1AV83_DAUCS|nr:PREDICTED: cytochrome P450 CYP736A12-like [Daucus carota subsp. sativus]WOG93766.1 hypothetical protein DCAR_0313053 [Daucus carota subsp. sativus]